MMKRQIMLRSILLSSTALMLVSCSGKIQVEPKKGELFLYPNPEQAILYPNEEIVFEFTSEDKKINIEDIKMNFDGNPKNDLTCGNTKIVTCFNQTIRTTHSYDEAGRYSAVVKLNDNNILFQKDIFISRTYMSDEELEYEAIKQIAIELEKGINKVTREFKGHIKNESDIEEDKKAKFSFSSLKDANFEYLPDKQDVKVIYRLMQALVENQKEGSTYSILEREPQALVRLAHESLWRESISSSKQSDFKEVLQQEYGLTTTYETPKKPIVYGIKLSGVEDSRSVVKDATKEQKTADSKTGILDSIIESVSKSKSESESVHNKNAEGLKKQSVSKRPLLFARFNTADFLVVIDRFYDFSVNRSQNIYYDSLYKVSAKKRTAKFKVNVRILDRKGQILWIKDISGEESDLVLPQFDPGSLKMKTEK